MFEAVAVDGDCCVLTWGSSYSIPVFEDIGVGVSEKAPLNPWFWLCKMDCWGYYGYWSGCGIDDRFYKREFGWNWETTGLHDWDEAFNTLFSGGLDDSIQGGDTPSGDPAAFPFSFIDSLSSFWLSVSNLDGAGNYDGYELGEQNVTFN